MKYENLDQINVISNQIKKHEIELNYLNDESAMIDILTNGKTISIRINQPENLFNEPALKFISECKMSLLTRIGELKLKLEQL